MFKIFDKNVSYLKMQESYSRTVWTLSGCYGKKSQPQLHCVNGPLRSVHTMPQRRRLFCRNKEKVFILWTNIMVPLHQYHIHSMPMHYMHYFAVAATAENRVWTHLLAVPLPQLFGTIKSNCYGKKMLPLLQPLSHCVNGPLLYSDKMLLMRRVILYSIN